MDLEERMRTCMVFDLPVNNGLFNTAVDEYFLNKPDLDFAIIFTEWRPTVSIGASQSLALDVDLDAVKRHNADLVRRKSGGQSVVLDENYIVFSIVGKSKYFPQDLTVLRKSLSEAIVPALKQFNVPAEFYEPDNVVVRTPAIRTLGNAGQLIKRDVVAVHGSIRYNLTVDSLNRIVETLKINGNSLAKYKGSIGLALGYLTRFTSAEKFDIKSAIKHELLLKYGFEDCVSKDLNAEEVLAIEKIVPNHLADKPEYKSRGVCYLYLKGKCIVPAIEKFLPTNKPSTHQESTLTG